LHQEAIERAAGEAVIQTAGVEHHDRVFWRMPSQERIKAQLQKREFQLIIKAIKPTNEDGTPKKPDHTPLKKKVPLFRTPVSVNASIWHLGTGQKCELHSDQHATLLGIQTSHGKVVSVNTSVVTSNPDKFQLPLDAQYGSSRRQGLPEDFEIMVTIDFNSSVDVEDILSIMDVDLPRLEGARPTRWRAKYPTLLDLPEREVSLPLTYHLNGGKSKTLGLGLEVCMRYTSHPGESLLSAANQQLKSEQRRTQSLLNRAAETARSSVEVTFAFLNETLTFQALRCPHCTWRIRQAFKSLDELHMHLRNSHDFFQYRVKKEKEVNGMQYWRFECDVADHKADQRPSDRAPDPRDVNIIAPRRPFNRRKYLDEGDEGWLKDAKLERPTRPALSRAVSSTTTIPVSRKAPDEVQPRVNGQKKKHRVPKAPAGVTFFRTLSKRPLREGEFISESDDDVDMEWLQSKTDSMITNNPTLPEKTKRFLMGFNNYMREERLQDDVHVGDALIRFANSEKEWLCNEGIQDEFKKKVTEFFEDQIISQEIHDRCISIVCRPQTGVPNRVSGARSANQPTPPRTPLSPTHNSKVNESPKSRNTVTDSTFSELQQYFQIGTDKQNNGKAKVTALGQTTPQTTDYEGDVEMAETNGNKEPSSRKSEDAASRFDECLCGRPAFAHRGSIIHCENDVSNQIDQLVTRKITNGLTGLHPPHFPHRLRVETVEADSEARLRDGRLVLP
jgi:hypothetical protein